MVFMRNLHIFCVCVLIFVCLHKAGCTQRAVETLLEFPLKVERENVRIFKESLFVILYHLT